MSDYEHDWHMNDPKDNDDGDFVDDVLNDDDDDDNDHDEEYDVDVPYAT